jgi:hypothetical protein
MSTSNIEGKSPQNGEVGGGVVFFGFGSDPRRERRRASSAERFQCPVIRSLAHGWAEPIVLDQERIRIDIFLRDNLPWLTMSSG